MYAWMDGRMYVCMHAWTDGRTDVRRYVCMYVSFTLSVRIDVRTYTNT